MTFKAFFRSLFCGVSTKFHDVTSNPERRPLVMPSHDERREAEVSDSLARTHAGSARGERRAQTAGNTTSNPPRSQNVARPNTTNSSSSRRGTNNNNNNRSNTVRHGTSSHPPPNYAPPQPVPPTSSRPCPIRPRMTTLDILTKNKPLPPIPEPLDRTTLLETLDTFHNSLSHTRYAVSGLAALAVWGYMSRLPTRVTIMCCSSDKDVIRTWAKVSGWYCYPNQPDVIGLPGRGTAIRQIRLRGFANEETFEWQGRVCPAGEGLEGAGVVSTRAMVLTPTALLNQFCQNYSLAIQHSASPGTHHPDSPQRTRAEHAQRAAETAELIIWILERMVEGKGQPGPGVWVPPGGELLNLIPHVMDLRFRIAFTDNYPASVALFEQCGFELSARHPGSYDFAAHEDWLNKSGPSAPVEHALSRLAVRDSSSTMRIKRHGSVFHGLDLLRLRTVASSSFDTSGSSTANVIPTDTDDTSLFDVSTMVSNGNSEEEENILATQWRIPDDLREMMEEAELEYKAKELWRWISSKHLRWL